MREPEAMAERANRFTRGLRFFATAVEQANELGVPLHWRRAVNVPYVHSSFPKMGLPHWFGYFIGTCEVLGPIAPAFILLILCGYVLWTARADMLKFGHAAGTAA